MMKSLLKRLKINVTASLMALSLGLTPLPSYSAQTDLNDIPMAVSNQVKANIMVILDNSQSMDAYMGGALQSGNNPATRGNLGRNVLRDTIGTYRNSFNWGLMSFATQTPELRNTYVFYMGSDTGMVFTDDCVAGISASNGGRRCVANPQAFSGGNFVTYDVSSDDPSILDALYTTQTFNAAWAISPVGAVAGSTVYSLWFTHSGGNDWSAGTFSDPWFTGSFTPTDAGFLPAYPSTSRMLFLPRGQGYIAPVTGGGKLWEAVLPDSTTHYDNLMLYLNDETLTTTTTEIKNASLFTTLYGSLISAKDNFSGQSDWKSGSSYTSPIKASCQKNFVMLVTDGLPTGNATGNLYTEAERTDTCSAWTGNICSGTWTYGTAANETFNAITSLRTTPYTGCTNCTAFDVETYVIALGDTVANARAVALMNQMALLGGTNTALFANDKTSLDNAITSVVNNAASKTAAAAAVAVANANVTTSTASYQSSYYSGTWSGELQSYLLDITTGAPLTNAPLWTPSAQGQLDVLAPTSRKIVSYTGTSGTGQGIQFQPTTAATATKLSAAQETLISATNGAGIVDFIRGVRTGEGTSYRLRAHVLGDIVNAEPVVVAGPTPNFNETNDPGYAAFKTAQASRQSLVFQGANDGMLHAFNAGTGAEEWAYVPSLVLSSLANLSSLNGFTHKYYVDGTPAVGDVDFIHTGGTNSSAASNNWRTLLVGGLGKGGFGYYALDITSGVPADEAAATSNVLWEFPNSSTAGQVVANIGYSFGKPIITKTDDQGWVVIVTSGYNNSRTVNVGGTNYTGDGRGHLFVLNAKTGALIKDISTGVGSNTSPSGLAFTSGYVENADADNTTTQIYSGDLDGNVWRFDVTGVASGWSVTKLATLVDASGIVQPVTTAPELAAIFEGNKSYRFIYVGTGRYLGDSDVSSTATQSMYGLIDDLTTTPTISPLRSNLQSQTLTLQSGGTRRTATSTAFNVTGSGKKLGWYVDLPASGERVYTDPQLAFGALIFTSNIPSTGACSPGGSSFLNIIDYRTGGAYIAGNLPWSSLSMGDALSSRAVLVRLPSGNLRALIRKSDATTVSEAIPIPPSTPNIRRVSWRELPDTQK